MHLNQDCIRDILLYVEENTTYEKSHINVDVITSALKDNYDVDTIYYHIEKIDQAGLVDNVTRYDDYPKLISCLSWEGHNYIDNIRDNKIWSKIKLLTKGLASISMPVLVEYAKNVAISFLPKP